MVDHSFKVSPGYDTFSLSFYLNAIFACGVSQSHVSDATPQSIE